MQMEHMYAHSDPLGCVEYSAPSFCRCEKSHFEFCDLAVARVLSVGKV